MIERLLHRTAKLATVLATCTLLGACGGSDRAATDDTATTPASATPAEAQSGSSAGSWTFCASEGGMCSFSGTRQVRYGTAGHYEYATHTGGVQCSNAAFGDPAYGKAKTCSVAAASTTAQPTATTPQTPPVAKTGTVALAWIAPQINADGTPLTDLAGYRVRYGNRSGSYSQLVDIGNPHTLNHVLKGLPAATYYLVVTAYNSANMESLASAEVAKSIE